MLPQLAQGDANTVFVIPGEITQALGQLGNAFGGGQARGEETNGPARPPRPRQRSPRSDAIDATAAADAEAAAAAARQATAEAQDATSPGPHQIAPPQPEEPPALES
jgi:hypothetical protein